MTEIILAVMMNLSFIWGIRLRYAPFAAIIEPPLRKRLITIYTVLLLLNTVLMSNLFLHYGVSIEFIQFDGFAIAAIVILTNRKLVTGRWKEHLFVFGIVESCTFLVLSVPILLIDLHGGFGPEESYLVAATIYCVLLLLSFRPIRVLLKSTVEPFLSLETGNYWTDVWFLPVGIYFGMVFNSMANIDAMSLPRLISRVFLSVTMLMLCLSTANDHRRMKEQQQTSAQLTDQKVHYAQLQTQVESARKNAHNYMHHIAAIRNLTEQADLDGLRRYCDELTEEYGFRDQIPYSGNAAADGVIYRYIKLARAHNINFTCQGTINTAAVSDLDLCVLLGNALENAFTACLTVKQDRQMQMMASTEGNVLSLMVTNSFDGVILEEDGVTLSRKREHAPGLGISSMQSVCDRCGGVMQTNWTEDRFTVLFLLPIS